MAKTLPPGATTAGSRGTAASRGGRLSPPRRATKTGTAGGALPPPASDTHRAPRRAARARPSSPADRGRPVPQPASAPTRSAARPRREGPAPGQGTTDPNAGASGRRRLRSQRSGQAAPPPTERPQVAPSPGGRGKGARRRTPHSLCHTRLFRPRTAGAILRAKPRRPAPPRPLHRRRAGPTPPGCSGAGWGGLPPADQPPRGRASFRSPLLP